MLAGSAGTALPTATSDLDILVFLSGKHSRENWTGTDWSDRLGDASYCFVSPRLSCEAQDGHRRRRDADSGRIRSHLAPSQFTPAQTLAPVAVTALMRMLATNPISTRNQIWKSRWGRYSNPSRVQNSFATSMSSSLVGSPA
jgi:hypothetical protein